MSSSILHQCQFCGHVSDISLSLASFIENPHCNQCGLSASESNGKMQDELAALFDRQMTMAPLPTAQTPSQPPITYSISQHYHHSAHVVPPSPSPAQPTVPTDMMNTNRINDVLWQHGLDPSNLSPSQIDLVKHADAEQQQRLIQTWLLYERSQQGPAYTSSSPAEDLEMDDSEGIADEHKGQAEPYMVSGYETAVEQVAGNLPKEPTTGEPYAASTDPAYKVQQWWEFARTGSMESQYGAFEERTRSYPTGGFIQASHYM
ncbi:uncharacterized protein N7459_005135 [Penicillium hispanicum]|uniref:uncharacterized protein n=1 Tax=Penicillium hispanicum TaxID=1080232 RepID=UPI00254257FB|nr:uncharacterized protein N7459_005135 [Penicillium hispanicum]KAJ5585335.1 hypothetical protein N7459_005135 [Penicillium hispanicum]